jgi:hypothetical protein
LLKKIDFVFSLSYIYAFVFHVKPILRVRKKYNETY